MQHRRMDGPHGIEPLLQRRLAVHHCRMAVQGDVLVLEGATAGLLLGQFRQAQACAGPLVQRFVLDVVLHHHHVPRNHLALGFSIVLVVDQMDLHLHPEASKRPINHELSCLLLQRLAYLRCSKFPLLQQLLLMLLCPSGSDEKCPPPVFQGVFGRILVSGGGRRAAVALPPKGGLLHGGKDLQGIQGGSHIMTQATCLVLGRRGASWMD